jgi:hypothetical protein
MDLEALCELTRKRAKELDRDDLDELMDEIRGFLNVGQYLPPTINYEKPSTIRKAQLALAKMERHLDVVVPLHHDAKRTLQIIASVEYQLTGALVRANVIPEKASGPVKDHHLAAAVPLLGRVKIRWTSLDKICTQAQQRLASARESIKLQAKLDDNLRWAQDRPPS